MVGLLWCLGHAELICGLSEGVSVVQPGQRAGGVGGTCTGCASSLLTQKLQPFAVGVLNLN